MPETTAVAVSLLQAGLLLGALLLARIAVVRHVPADAIPDVLRGRVVLSNRLCPWLLVGTVTMTAAGLVLHLFA